MMTTRNPSAPGENGRPDIDTVRRLLERFSLHHDDQIRRGETCSTIGENIGVAVANVLLARIKRKDRRDANQ